MEMVDKLRVCARLMIGNLGDEGGQAAAPAAVKSVGR